MAIRNYVGARYVPKFADPVEWQANTSYEAMVIVTYNNSSYTSKIPVPPTVGNPPENSTYWALTGNYNAQVEQYRQETETVRNNLNAEITNRENTDTALQEQITQETETVRNNLNAEITNRENADTALQEQITQNQHNINLIRANNKWQGRRIIIVGDSYNVGYQYESETNITGWGELLINYLKPTYSLNLKQNGAGFTNGAFLQLINNNIAESQELITDIIVGGDYNDRLNIDKIYSAMTTFVSRCRQLYPNATIWIAPIGSAINALDPYHDFNQANMKSLINNWIVSAIKNGCNVINNVWSWGWYNNFQSDFVHPNETGEQLIALLLADKLLGESNSVNKQYNDLLTHATLKTGVSIGNPKVFNAFYSGNGCYTVAMTATFNFDAIFNDYTCNWDTKEILTINEGGLYVGSYFNGFHASVGTLPNGDTYKFFGPCVIKCINNTISLGFGHSENSIVPTVNIKGSHIIIPNTIVQSYS